VVSGEALTWSSKDKKGGLGSSYGNVDKGLTG